MNSSDQPIPNAAVTTTLPTTTDVAMSDGDAKGGRASVGSVRATLTRRSAWTEHEDYVTRRRSLAATQDPIRAVLQRLSEVSGEEPAGRGARTTSTVSMSRQRKDAQLRPALWLRSACAAPNRPAPQRFDNAKVEELYGQYFFNSNKTSLLLALLYLAAMDAVLVALHYATGQRSIAYGVAGSVLFVAFIALAILFRGLKSSSSRAYLILSILSIVCLTLFDLINVLFCLPLSAASNLWCACVIIFIAYAMIPVPVSTSLRFAFLLSIGHFAALAWLYYFEPTAVMTAKHMLATILIVLGTNVVGIFICYPVDVVQREAFRETRGCIEARLKTQKENEKQERLLLSVLPRHIALEMKDDIAELPKETMFHKIYIQKHNNIRYNFFTKMTNICDSIEIDLIICMYRS